MPLRAVVVATGSELVRGDIRDANGGFLATEVARLGFDPSRIVVVGDRPEELRAALRRGVRGSAVRDLRRARPDPRRPHRRARRRGRRGAARAAPRARGRDRGRLARVRRAARPRLRGVRARRAQAGDAPGRRDLAGSCRDSARVRATDGRRPRGRPPGAARRAAAPLAARARDGGVSRAAGPHRGARAPRRCASSGSASRRSPRRSRDAGGDGDGVEATICARDFEIHVDLLVSPGGEERAAALEDALASKLEPFLFSRDERPVEQIVLDLCREAGVTLATAESCTGGLVAALVTALPGSSDGLRRRRSSRTRTRVKEQALGVPRGAARRARRRLARGRAGDGARRARGAGRRRRRVRDGRGRTRTVAARRSRSGSCTSTPSRHGARRRCASRGRPTARRCASGRRRARSISCAVSWSRIVTVPCESRRLPWMPMHGCASSSATRSPLRSGRSSRVE